MNQAPVIIGHLDQKEKRQERKKRAESEDATLAHESLQGARKRSKSKKITRIRKAEP